MKTNRAILVLMTALVSAGGIVWAADPAGRYIWPLEGKPIVTSGFCDYRHQHYHGGIDISTDGREGIPVRAADSGWVMRISTSYWGYGKGLYVQMADGRIAVYGHLSKFSPKIAEYVEERQYAAKRYQQNLLPGPGELPVSRGEIVAESGQSGAGPPHLHFEIRTRDNRPLNPLKFAFEKPDKVAPKISSVTLVPRHPDRFNVLPSRVDGGLARKDFTVSGAAKERTLAETPVIAGRVGVAVEASDEIDASRGTVSIYRCRLFVNGVQVAGVSQDSVNYDDTRLIDLHRLYDGRAGIAERPVNLFRLPGNRLWHYDTLMNDGWLEFGQTVTLGANNLRIEVEDAAGNSSFAEFKIMVQDLAETAAQTTGAAAAPDQGKSLELLPILWANNGVVVQLNHGSPSRATYFADRQLTQPLVALKANSESPVVWIPAAEPIGDTVWVDTEGGPLPHAIGAHAVSGTEGGVVVSNDGLARVRFAAGNLYESSFLRLEQENLSASKRPTVSAAYRLTPSDLPFARNAKLMIGCAGAADMERLAVYRYRPDQNSWVYEGGERDSAGAVITAEVSAPGIFALLADRNAPSIQGVKPGKGETTTDRQPAIRFEMSDDLAGIGSDADVLLTIDGEWTLVEYDADTGQAKARPRKALAPGEHRVEIVVKDRVGNEESFLRILRIAE